MNPMSESLEAPARPYRAGRDRGAFPLAALAVYALLYTAWLLTSRLPARSRSFGNDLAFLPFGLLPFLLALRVARGALLDAATRRAWRFLAAAFACLWLGDLLWFASAWLWPDRNAVYVCSQIAYVAFYPPALIGLFSFPRFLRTRSESRQFWLDVATVFLGGLMALWSVLLAPLTTLAGSSLPNLALAIAYILGDLILIFGIGVIVVRRREESTRFVLLPLAIGIVAMLLNDTVFSVLAASGEAYQSGTSVDLIGMIAWLLFGASAAAQWRVAELSGGKSEVAPGPGSMSLVPYIAVVIGYGALFLAALDRRTPSLGGIVVGAIALTATVLTRQALAVRENVRLSADSAARQSEARFRTLVQNSRT